MRHVICAWSCIATWGDSERAGHRGSCVRTPSTMDLLCVSGCAIHSGMVFFLQLVLVTDTRGGPTVRSVCGVLYNLDMLFDYGFLRSIQLDTVNATVVVFGRNCESESDFLRLGLRVHVTL
mmetsp:Transcript_40250/g.87121  ORF Transcript_40250/g.87121 Transcript_40250/m.87121 type:complete len:121 (+) Transcript_40250:3-365(+)